MKQIPHINVDVNVFTYIQYTSLGRLSSTEQKPQQN